MLTNFIKKPIRFLMTSFGQRFEKLFNKDILRNEIKKILVFQTGGIGDVLRIFPLIEILRSDFPFAKIATLTEYPPDIFKLMNNRSIIDETLRFDFKKKTFLEKAAFLFELRKSSYDLIISPSRGSGMFECAIISFLIGKKWRVGFMKEGIGFLYTNKIEFRDDVPIVRQNVDLLRTIGIQNNTNDTRIKIAIPKEDLLFAHKLLKEAKDNNRIIAAVSPTVSNHPELFEWPLENFIELSRLLIKNKDAFIVLLGSKKDLEMSYYFEEQVGEKICFKNLVGKTDLLKACALIKSCDLFVGNDSGLLHIANALSTPAVGIFGSSSPEQVLSDFTHAVVVARKYPCSPCYVHQPDFDFICCDDVKCLRDISVNEVLNAINRLMQNNVSETIKSGEYKA